MSEYIRLIGSEKVYGQKHLLYSQLSLIQIAKLIKNYKDLRNEELVLKVALKSKINEIQSDMEVLDKILPKATIKEIKSGVPKVEVQDKERTSLEQEIDMIRRKLSKLQGQ